ncbi:MAG TPA: RNA methyltransferase [Pyrinomonadaceae bacterium]|nr:RNA methyltransferase [Pyrinomonadaceae bacterium]
MVKLSAMRTDLRQITSRDNDRIKSARRVRDGKVEDKIFLEGLRLVTEAVRSRTRIDSLYVSSDARAAVEELVNVAGTKVVYEVSDSIFQSLADTTTAQGIIAIADRPTAGRDEIARGLESSAIRVVVFLDRINNPSNLGAVLRTVEAAGAAGVIVSTGSADAYSPKALRSAMGSSLRLALWTDANFDDAVAWAKGIGLASTAADIVATVDYTEVDWYKPRMLVLGSEASGLADEVREQMDELILIPMENKVESLNLAVACGVILFEAKRQVRT